MENMQLFVVPMTANKWFSSSAVNVIVILKINDTKILMQMQYIVTPKCNSWRKNIMQHIDH